MFLSVFFENSFRRSCFSFRSLLPHLEQIQFEQLNNMPFVVHCSNGSYSVLTDPARLINSQPEWYATTRLDCDYDPHILNKVCDPEFCEDPTCPHAIEIIKLLVTVLTNGRQDVEEFFWSEVSENEDQS